MNKKYVIFIVISAILISLSPLIYAAQYTETESFSEDFNEMGDLTTDRRIPIIHFRFFQKHIFIIPFPMLFINREIQWNFGDQMGEFGRNIIIHEYNGPGTYQVTATYTSVLGVDWNAERQITVRST